MPTPVVRDGEVRMLDPMTPAGVVEFGDPVGPAETVYTIHSEQATFPQSFGARDVAFQLSLDPAFLAKVRLLAEIGLAGTEPVEVDGHAVVPRRLLLTLLARLPRAEPSMRTVGVHRIEAYGPAGTAVVECVTRAVPGFGFGGGIASTACPPARRRRHDLPRRARGPRRAPERAGGAVSAALRAPRALRRRGARAVACINVPGTGYSRRLVLV